MVPGATTLAEALRAMRARRALTLRDVERVTAGAVSNVYLSQLETGRRTDPNPRLLVALSKAYGVPLMRLFELAGYIEAPLPSAVDVAFEQVVADTTFQFGTRFKGELDQESKRVIVELYEQATGKKLLSD